MPLKSINQTIYLSIILVFATIMVLLKIGQADLNEWDESRNGINAYEMCHNHDFINLYYDGKPDTWNAKPPLFTWLLVGAYHIFGFNEFALRLPTAICVIVFFILFFKIIMLYEPPWKAFLSCLMLLSCKAILGKHIGLSGDYDMLLLCFLTAGAYYFLRYIDLGKRKSILLTGLFTGFAFYTKGPAAFIYIPSLLLYACYRHKLLLLLKDRLTWLAIFICIAITASWIVLLSTHGQSFRESAYGSKNSLETMFVFDTFKRFTSSEFEAGSRLDYLFFFSAIDARLNLWNYMFYISVVIGAITLHQHRTNLTAYLQKPSNRLLIFSICIIVPIAIALTIAANKHDWYLVPLFPYLAYVTLEGILFLSKKHKVIPIVVGGLFIFTLVRHISFIYSQPQQLHSFFKKDNAYLRSRQLIITDRFPKQNVALYLIWLGIPVKKIYDHELPHLSPTNAMIIFKKEQAVHPPISGLKEVNCFEDYCAGIID